MNDWLSEHWQALTGFLAGTIATVFLGGRAYQKMNSKLTDHDDRIKATETALAAQLERQRKVSGEIFNKIDGVRTELHGIGLQQASLTSSVDQYGKRMDALVDRYDRANERAEQLMQEHLEALRKISRSHRSPT